MQKILEFQVRISKDGTACMDEQSKSCGHYETGRCKIFDATLHEDVQKRPCRCNLCLQLKTSKKR